MKIFTSFLSMQMEEFIRYRKAAGNWNGSYEENLKLFDVYVARNFPDSHVLSQDMANSWCTKRETEANNSCRSRIYVVISFLKYLKKRNRIDIDIPEVPRKERRTYIPHAFTDSELTAFFHKCDSLSVYHNSLPNKLHKIIIPVFFRLLFSSGMRTTEARLLKRKDVNLDNGVVSIRDSKGDDRHYVVLHDSMAELMQKYDTAVDKLIPKRIYFFPSMHDKPHPRGWVVWNFHTIWSRANDSEATAYELRHNYAIHNINKWTDTGFDFNDRLLYLSKSMGHRTVEETKRYFSIVPALSEILSEKTGYGMDIIIPEVY